MPRVAEAVKKGWVHCGQSSIDPVVDRFYKQVIGEMVWLLAGPTESTLEIGVGTGKILIDATDLDAAESIASKRLQGIYGVRCYRFYLHRLETVTEFLVDLWCSHESEAREKAIKFTQSYGAKVTFEELKK
jgi:hypothetical protein